VFALLAIEDRDVIGRSGTALPPSLSIEPHRLRLINLNAKFTHVVHECEPHQRGSVAKSCSAFERLAGTLIVTRLFGGVE